MKNNRMKDVLENIARRAVADDVNLMPNIAAQVERKPLTMKLRARPALTMLLVMLLLALLTGVAYAVGKVIGYVPGVGLIDQSVPVRILTEPVIIERDGLQVILKRVVADVDRTRIAYGVLGIPVPREGFPLCGQPPSLKLPDGSTLTIQGGGEGGIGGEAGKTMGYDTEVYFGPIPPDVNNVTLIFPCILPEGTGPEDWQIPLMLAPAPEGYATPGVEIGATFVASNPSFVVSPTPTTDMRIFTPEPPDTLPPTFTPVPNGSGLYLEKVIELPDSYILVGNFTDAGDLPGALEVSSDPNDGLPRIEDDAGNSVAFKLRADAQPEMGSGVRYWAFEIAKPVSGFLTVTLDQVNVARFYTFDFQFDAGANPQTGQMWTLNLPIRLGNYEYVMDSVEVVENGYLFKYHSGKDVPEGTSPMFNIIGHTPEQDSSELNNKETIVEYSDKLVFSSPFPTGQLTVELMSIETVPLTGPWTLKWSPPDK